MRISITLIKIGREYLCQTGARLTTLRILYFATFLLFFVEQSPAESNLKNLVLTNCEKASEIYFKLPEEEQLQFFDFFKRVLELNSTQLPADPGNRDNYLLAMQPPSNSPFGSKPVVEDYFKSTSPTREVDAKLCVLKIAHSRLKDSFKLLPGLFDLESNPLLSDESRFFLRQSLLEIAHANVSDVSTANKVMEELISKLTEKNYWLFSALLSEFGSAVKPVTLLLVSDKDDLKFRTAVSTIQLERDNQDILADILDENSNSITPKRAEILLKLVSKTNLTSPKLFRLILAKLSQPTEPNKALLLKVLERSAESVLELVGKESELEPYLSSIFLNLPLSEISGFVEMTCVAGRCDKVLSSIVRTPTLVSGVESKLLNIIALSENFSSESWKFAEDNWKNLKSPNRTAALPALSAFPGKKEIALTFLYQAIKELSSEKKSGSENRAEALRSLANSMVSLSPITASSIPQKIGEEILGLSPHGSDLPSLAIASIKPSPISLFIRGIHSKSESTVEQALLALEKSHPLDTKLFVSLLELAGEASIQQDSENKNITADRVIASYEDAGLTILEQLVRSKNEVIARKAAIRLLIRRPTNKVAQVLLLNNFSKLGCGAKFQVVSLLKDGKLFKADQLKHCISELEGSSLLKAQLFNTRSSFSSEDWLKLISLLPETVLISECSQGNLLVAKEIIASKIRSSIQASYKLEMQILNAECSSRMPELLQPEDKAILISLLDEQIKNSATLNLKRLAASIRLGSRSEIVRTSFAQVLEDENLSSVLGKMLVGTEQMESLILNLDNCISPGADNFICNSHITNSELEKELLGRLSRAKDENILPLVQSLSCLNPESAELQSQFYRVALTPVFQETNRLWLTPPLMNILKQNPWSLNYLAKRYESLSRATHESAQQID